MRIGLDARKASHSGIGTYIRNLVTHLLEVGEKETYVLFHAPGDEELLPRPDDRVRLVVDRSPGYSLREHITLSWRARREGVDLFHAPHYVVPLAVPGRCVVTVHDLIHLRVPGALPTPLHRAVARGLLEWALRRAQRVITDSAASARDILSAFPRTAGRLRVIPLGVEEAFFELSPSQVPLERRPFLFVGNLKPHKNLPRALRAFADACGGFPHGLLCIGLTRAERGRAGRIAAGLGIGDRVAFRERVPSDSLREIYRDSLALFMPSRYEGFGLPALEAMAVGIPVIASTTPALLEVVGDAALLLDATAPAAMAGALQRIAADPELRRQLAERGRRRARGFSWREAAQRTLEVYREALEGT